MSSSFQSRAKKQQLVRPDAAAELASLPATAIAAKWDKASKLQRCDILASFVERFHACTAAEIERFFGAGAQLFFARLTATLRLSYKTMAVSCDRFGILLLMAVGLFLQGQRFLTSFAEVGGIQLLCDFVASIPNCCPAAASDELLSATQQQSQQQQQQQQQHGASVEAAAKSRGVRLLVHIANSGRVYREMVCEDGGLQHLVNATCFESDDSVLELLGSLFLSLGHGNPRRVRDVHAALLHLARTGNDSAALCAASTLRALQVSRIGPPMPSSNTAGGGDVSAAVLVPDGGDGIGGTGRVSTLVGSASAAAASRNSVGLVSEEVDFSTSNATSARGGAAAATASPLRAAHVSPLHFTAADGAATAAAAAEQEAGLVLYLDSLFHLLRSPSVRVRFEGIELLSLSAPGPGMLPPMLKRVVDILDDVDTTLHAISAMSYDRERAFLHLHASCVRLLFALLTHRDEAVAAEAMRAFEARLLHLCLGRFMRVTQEFHNKSMMVQSLRYTAAASSSGGAAAAAQSLLRHTGAPTAAPGVQDAVRIFKCILAASSSASSAAAAGDEHQHQQNAQLISANVLALSHSERVRKATEGWLRKTLQDDNLFAPLLDPASSLHDPYVLAITQRLAAAHREQLASENELEVELEAEAMRALQPPQQQKQQQQPPPSQKRNADDNEDEEEEEEGERD